MSTSMASFLSRLPRGRRLGRAAIRRWPALAVATVVAAVPMGVALASLELTDFGPSRFTSDGGCSGWSTCPAISVSANHVPAIVADGTIRVNGAFGNYAGEGVQASTRDGTGVVATAYGTGTGLKAISANGTAISAEANTTAVKAVGGSNAGSIGVQATGETGVDASGRTGGIKAYSSDGIGVRASGKIRGVTAYADAAGSQGVFAFGDRQGILAEGKIGGEFSGSVAPIRLKPASTVGAPSSDVHSKGELYVDANGQLFLCVADGAPGTWKKVHLDN
jgi:hypothetical protein